MEQTDFGQIDIYENLFWDLDCSTIKGNPISCLESGTSYCGLYNNMELPIMIGSKFDIHDNPLKIKGYFIIDGICKSINNIKFYYKTRFSKDRCHINNRDKIIINSMFDIKISVNNKLKNWYLPINWKDIIKYSVNKYKLETHLKLILEVNNFKNTGAIRNEIDLINLCYMFDCWLNEIEEPNYTWRLITVGEIFKYCIDKKINIIQCFRTNNWEYNNITDINTISEDMKHYNIINDIESIRRITLFKNRENTKKEDRMVKLEDKYKICPVQTPDGSICGTVNYLCRDAKIVTVNKQIEIETGDDLHLYINNLYKGKIKRKFVDKLSKENFEIYQYGITVYAFYEIGFIIKSNYNISYTASLIKYRNYNPPIRAMFASSMIKQSIEYDHRNIRTLINKSKVLANPIDKNVETAIMTWYGFNIEDGIVISKSLSEKYSYIRTKIYKENNIKIINIYKKENEYVEVGDALYKTLNTKEIKAVNIIYSEESGYVEKIINKRDSLKMIISRKDVLKVGDKMTSMNGQKGVISLIELDENMPYYYKNGVKIKIELIINPHAFPSRMTMGQIKEMGDKEETVYINNIQIKNKIIVGKCQYLALRHQVDDKFQYRNQGKYDIINRQPVAGRKNNGGIRFGQMERDILIGLGHWDILKEYWSIDKSKVKICENSGIINPNCCFKEMSLNQGSLICIAYLRGMGYDINIKDNKYKITYLDRSLIPNTEDLNFGDINPLDIRIMRNVIILPMCLRSNKLKYLYKNISKNIINDKVIKEIINETKKLLKSKNGAYHRLIEGHRIDRCIRSVITPNPNISVNEVFVPIEANINCEYGILNRQPSLNSSSIKIVKINVHKEKTISFNPLLCKSFNADFDGDEMNIYGLSKETASKLGEIKNESDKTQDYILGSLKEITERGLTANESGIKTMISNKSKGKDFNYQHIYLKIDDEINECYFRGISENNWYKLCIEARENIISIAINTPVTGDLRSVCIQKLI